MLLTLAAALVVVWVVGGTSWLVLTNPTSHVQKVQVVLGDGREAFLGEVGAGETVTQVIPLASDQGGLVVTTQAGRFTCSEYLTFPERWGLLLNDTPSLKVAGGAVHCTR